MIDGTAMYAAIYADMISRFRGFEVRRKDTSMMRAIGVVFGVIGFVGGMFRGRPLIGYREGRDRFMQDFVTTIGRVVYMDDPRWDVLAHEREHVEDGARHPIWFPVSYLFPQVLSPLALLAIPFSLWFLGALVFLAPLPAPWRVKWERRGYLVSMVCDVLQHGPEYVRSDKYQKWRAANYTGSVYYFMSWRPRAIAATVKADANLAISIASMHGTTFVTRDR